MRTRISWALLWAITACGDHGTGPRNDARDPRIRWVHEEAAGTYYGSPALSLDEATVYIGTSRGILAPLAGEHAVVALNVATGALRWRFATGAAEVRSSPAVGPDGSVTVVIEERTASGTLLRREVLRLSAVGGELWRRALGVSGTPVQIGYAAPAIGVDGSVFVAADSLYALNPDGSIRWTRLGTGEEFRATPVIAPDGTVYFVSHNIPLTALDPVSGDIRWQIALGPQDHVVAPLSLGGDGTIYAADAGCVLYAVAPSGTMRWSFDATSLGPHCSIRSSPTIDASGTIIVGTTDRSPLPVILGINADGTLRWVTSPSNLPSDVPASHFDIYSSAAVGSDGVAYVGHEFGRVYGVDAQTGIEKWYLSTGELGSITWGSPALTTDGLLLISTLPGAVLAIETPSRGLQAQAPWPRYRGSNQSGGRR